jgi:hypothetical protein
MSPEPTTPTLQSAEDEISHLHAVIIGLREALATAQQERDSLKSLDDLRRTSNARIMAALKRIAVTIEDDEPQDLGYVDFLDMLLRTRWPMLLEAETELRNVRGTVEAVRAHVEKLHAEAVRYRESTLDAQSAHWNGRAACASEVLASLGAAGTPTPARKSLVVGGAPMSLQLGTSGPGSPTSCSELGETHQPPTANSPAVARPAGTAEPPTDKRHYTCPTHRRAYIGTCPECAAGTGPQEPRPTPREVNMNDNVWIKLTPRGRAHLESTGIRRSQLVTDGGWSQWQLWDVMATFGALCYMGGQVPFETTIRFESAAPTRQPPRAEPPQGEK